MLFFFFFLELDVATLYQSRFQQDPGKLGQEKTALGTSEFKECNEKGNGGGIKMKNWQLSKISEEYIFWFKKAQQITAEYNYFLKSKDLKELPEDLKTA